MTSGTFQTISIESVIVNRGDRQRTDLPAIDELAESIHRLGLINPITITKDLILVAGERRLIACQSLGWTQILVQFVEDEEPNKLEAIELEENIKRVDLSWQDRTSAITRYHWLRSGEVEGWTQEDTAAALGISNHTVGKNLSVGRELKAANPKITSSPKLSTAINLIQRAELRRDEKALAKLEESLIGEKTERPKGIINADFSLWAPAYTGPKFNFIHCDFPYGIGIDTHKNQFGPPAESRDVYEDSEDVYWALCDSFTKAIPLICAESCHFMFWFSMRFYYQTLEFFNRNSDITFDPFPLVWHKTDNAGILPDPNRGPRRTYETAFYGSRGDRRIARSVGNSHGAPTSRERHISEKPEPMLKHFFQMFVDPSTIFLDPTCGSGSSVRAAEAMNAAFALGVEKDSEFAESASIALNRARGMRGI